MDFYIPYVWPVKLKMLKQLFFGFPPLCWLVSPNEKKKTLYMQRYGRKKKKKKNNYLIFDVGCQFDSPQFLLCLNSLG